MKQKILVVAMSAMLLAISHTSQATPIVLSGSIADGTLLGAGNHSGLFDGSGLLPSSFKINSASFLFDFTDDQDSATTTINQQKFDYDYYVKSSGVNFRHWYRDTNIYKSVIVELEPESVDLFFGVTNVGKGLTSSTTTISGNTQESTYLDSSNTTNGYYETYSCGNRSCKRWVDQPYYTRYYNNITTQTTTTVKDWAGNFSISGVINDAVMLNSLLMGKQLQWDLSVGGDLYLTKAQLTLDIDEIKQVDPSAVAAPSTVLMTLFGLLGIAGYKRSRRVRKN